MHARKMHIHTYVYMHIHTCIYSVQIEAYGNKDAKCLYSIYYIVEYESLGLYIANVCIYYIW